MACFTRLWLVLLRAVQQIAVGCVGGSTRLRWAACVEGYILDCGGVCGRHLSTAADCTDDYTRFCLFSRIHGLYAFETV